MAVNSSNLPSVTENTMAQEWWVQRWIDLLNTYRFKKRLERGRIYAREGNILHMEFRNGKVHAKVQGTAPEPYKLTISIERFSDEDWQFVVASMAEKAIYSAKLLSGTMPDDIETVFTSNGLSLFPFTLGDVRSRCNCPDPKNPCKHIAAVYYQLGDFFREDPFVLFQLRGRTKTEILEAIRYHRSNNSTNLDNIVEETEQTTQETNPTTNESLDEQTLISDVEHSLAVHAAKFWQYNTPLDPSLIVITPPTSSQTVLDILGKLPLAPNDAQTIRQYLDGVYQSTNQQAMIMALSHR